MTPADVRERLTRALRLDLVGPEPTDPQVEEVLDRAPSRWYLTGFLVPSSAPATQKSDEDDRGDFDLEASPGGDEEDATHETPAARRGYFPSSIGLSVLAPPDAEQLRVTARWGDYELLEKDGKPTGEWRRRERQETVPIRLKGEKVDRSPATVPHSNGLEIVTSVRRVRGLEHLPGLPTGTRAISVFLVNRREPREGPDELRDSVFAFQARLTVEADRPFVPRPNSRGREGNDADERIAELQYRDVAEFAVGHGIATRGVVAEGGSSQYVETSWMPQAEVERVEPAAIPDVELAVEALASAPDAATLRSLLAPLPSRYRAWVEEQTKAAPKGASQAEVAADLLQGAIRAARRIETGFALLDDATALEAFRLTNRAMAMAARQRRAQERNVDPASVEPPQWRPFQLAFLLLNLQAFVTPGHTDRELVDLLFFPTGGGKTEAYFGLSAFAILLRRLRDPSLSSAGVAVLMRYTLRLLTLDQLSRASTLICALELIRQEAREKLGAWPFEIGLWVGKAATPNRMGRKGEKDDTSARAKTIRYRNNSRKAAPIPLETCPWCGWKLKPTSFLLWPDAQRNVEAGVLFEIGILPINSFSSLKG